MIGDDAIHWQAGHEIAEDWEISLSSVEKIMLAYLIAHQDEFDPSSLRVLKHIITYAGADRAAGIAVIYRCLDLIQGRLKKSMRVGAPYSPAGRGRQILAGRSVLFRTEEGNLWAPMASETARSLTPVMWIAG